MVNLAEKKIQFKKHQHKTMSVNVLHFVPPDLVPLIKLIIISTVSVVLMKAVEKPHHKNKINIIKDYLNICMLSPQFCHRP